MHPIEALELVERAQVARGAAVRTRDVAQLLEPRDYAALGITSLVDLAHRLGVAARTARVEQGRVLCRQTRGGHALWSVRLAPREGS